MELDFIFADGLFIGNNHCIRKTGCTSAHTKMVQRDCLKLTNEIGRGKGYQRPLLHFKNYFKLLAV